MTVANRHFAKLADVWKHLPLAEILATERPDHYCETHAGNASYAMVDDPERRFGVPAAAPGRSSNSRMAPTEAQASGAATS